MRQALIRAKGPMTAEGWFTVELMILLDKEHHEMKKVQRNGDLVVDGRRIEIRASSHSNYMHIIRGWKEGIDVLLFGGIIYKQDTEKLSTYAEKNNWKIKIDRIDDNVAVGLLKRLKEH